MGSVERLRTLSLTHDSGTLHRRANSRESMISQVPFVLMPPFLYIALACSSSGLPQTIEKLNARWADFVRGREIILASLFY